ncbi:putative ABC transporter type 1, transmembrane domain-containing protein [Helianthus annuus]|nr:putative ABC transporter type 1, transmembrane domain-containing protein [Helianthus annuus]
MSGVTAYHLLNPLEEPHRIRGESAKGIESERDEHVLILYARFFMLSYFARLYLGYCLACHKPVASFTGEKKAVTDYNKSLVDAYNSSVHEGLVTGFGIGSMVFIMFCSYALAVWFGAKLILERGYTGGDVITIVFAVVTGSM